MMASTKKNTNTAKATVWTSSARSQMEGPTKAIVYYMFMMVPAEEREQLLKDLHEWQDSL